MKSLPEWMYIDGTVYYYFECKGENPELKDWFFCGLFQKEDGYGIPPLVKLNDGSSVYLCSSGFSFEEARKDLLDRINNMAYEISSSRKNSKTKI